MRATLVRGWLAAALLATTGLATDAAAAEVLPGALPLRRDGQPVSDGGAWTPSLLLVGLAVAGGGFVWWRRSGRGGSNPVAARRCARAVTRVASQALTAQASVHAVRWNGEEYLLGCTPQQVTLLARRAVAQAEEDHP